MSLTHRDYTVGCICPMGVELAPVKAVLDRIHPSLPTQRDQNSYVLGEMCGHNVVVAVLPEIGNNAAATTAVQLMNDFPSIRFGLLVGIGGGVPDEEEGHDIRLGDVVVSKPTNTFGGVIQYDLGKETSSGFQRTGTLNKPPAVLLSAVEQLRATHMMEDSQTSHYLSQMIERYPKMKDHYSYPGTYHDQLFRSSYDHRGGTTCDDCDKRETIERPVRAHAGPSVHYGTIGSANKVVKNATERDKLKKEMKILCVEMEVAGLMDSFPCLVIRGICDYADSHKNEKWQPYAAAVAAAYMKELLVVIHPQNVAQTSPVVEVVQSLAVQFAAESEERRQSDTEANFFKSLTDNNQPKRKHNIRPEHYGTFQWAFAEDEDGTPSDLTTWLSSGAGIFWVRGKPGSGKSTFMKFLADNNQTIVCLHAWRSCEPLVLDFYFWLADTTGMENSFRGFLFTLLYDLLRQRPDLIATIAQKKDMQTKRRTSDWNTNHLKCLLMEAAEYIAQSTPLCLFVDGLDECVEPDFEKFLMPFLASLAGKTNIKICVSARPEESIRYALSRTFPGLPALDLQTLTEADIKKYVSENLREAPSGRIMPSSGQQQLRHTVISVIVSRAEGVFLWVYLVLKAVNTDFDLSVTIEQVLEYIEELPSDISELYRNMLRRRGKGNKRTAQESSMYIQLALYLEDHKPIGNTKTDLLSWAYLGYFVGCYQQLNGRPWHQTRGYNLEKEKEDLELVHERIVRLTVGMLEVGEYDVAWYKEVKFLHRTGRDFFLTDAEGMKLLEPYRLTVLEVFELVLDAKLRAWRVGIRDPPSLDELTHILAQLKIIQENPLVKPDAFATYLRGFEKTLARFVSGTDGNVSGRWLDKVRSLDIPYGGPVDYLGLTVHAGLTDYFDAWFGEHLQHKSGKKHLSQEYKDYLLLCASTNRFGKRTLATVGKFLDLGGNPNSTFYLAADFPVKNTPFLEFCRSIEKNSDKENRDETISAFIKSGANLDDRFITAYFWGGGFPAYLEEGVRKIAPVAKGDDNRLVFIVEKNAAHHLQHHEEVDIPSHHRVLLVRPGIARWSGKGRPSDPVSGWIPPGVREYAEIQTTDSESVEDMVRRLPRHPWSTNKYANMYRAYERLVEICNRSPKVGLEEYLEEKGYYKRPDDPEVLNGLAQILQQGGGQVSEKGTE